MVNIGKKMSQIIVEIIFHNQNYESYRDLVHQFGGYMFMHYGSHEIIVELLNFKDNIPQNVLNKITKIKSSRKSPIWDGGESVYFNNYNIRIE